ncbi:carboxyltransferase domain-containing protein [Enterobacter hormaechei]
MGSVGLAGEFSLVFTPTQVPGGWQIIGCTTETLFARTGSCRAIPTPGHQAQFVDVTRAPGLCAGGKPQPLQQISFR